MAVNVSANSGPSFATSDSGKALGSNQGVSVTSGTNAKWVTGKYYIIGDLVSYLGINYICVINGTSSTNPLVNTTQWATAGNMQILTQSATDPIVLNGGICFTDFIDTNNFLLDIPFSFKDNKLTGTLPTSIVKQTYNALDIDYWDPATTYAVGNKVIYKDLFYTRLVAGTTSTTPDLDETNWSYLQSAFHARLVPSENTSIPALTGAQRFNYFVKSLSFEYTDVWSSSDLYDIYFLANMLSGTEISSLTNASFVDGVGNTKKFGLYNILGTLPSVGNQAYCSCAANSYAPVVGQKLRLRGIYGLTSSQYVDVTVAAIATAWVSGTTYAVGDIVTYQTGYYVRLVAGAGTTAPNLDTTNWALRNTVDLDVRHFYITVDNKGAWASGTTYYPSDVVTNGGNYYRRITTGSGGSAPTGTNAVWQSITGLSIPFGELMPIINKWDIFLDTDFFAANFYPSPAGSSTSANAEFEHKQGKYEYYDNIVPQHQVLFSSENYLIHQGYPFAKSSLLGVNCLISARILNDNIVSTPRPTIGSNVLNSDSKFLPNIGSFPIAGLTWSDTSSVKTLVTDVKGPVLLTGDANDNYCANSNILQLNSFDSAGDALSSYDSIGFLDNDYFYTNSADYDFYTNGFTSLMVIFPDNVTDYVKGTNYAGSDYNWYPIMSQYTTASGYNLFNDKRLSVRYNLDGKISLNIGETILTSLQANTGVNSVRSPIVVGLTINPTGTKKSATLTVLSDDLHQDTVQYEQGSFTYNPSCLMYGGYHDGTNILGAHMYVLEIDNYFGNKTSEFIKNELLILDRMYGVTYGRGQ